MLVAPYGGPALETQGHVAIVSSWEDYETRNQGLIQSDAYDWFGRTAWGFWGTPGPNEKRTMWETHRDLGANFKWAGLIVGQWILDGFPGFEGYKGKERAMWTAECMEQLGEEFGVTIPRFYAANMILTENTPCLDPNTEYNDIRDAPGYLTPVDHDSYGPGQMRARYWPIPWSFTVTVACFARALAEHAHDEGISELPTDAGAYRVLKLRIDDLTPADNENLTLTGLSGANLSGADLKGVFLEPAYDGELTPTNLSGADVVQWE